MRTSCVGVLRVLSVGMGSIVLIGDSAVVSPRSRTLAVQRQAAVFWGDEGNMENFRIFSQNIPEPRLDDNWSFSVRNDNPTIHVGCINIYGISASGILQIGSNKAMDMEDRTINIRHLMKGKRPV